jgi:hypothetical protein
MKYYVLLAANGYSRYLDCQISSIDLAFRKANQFGILYISFDGNWVKNKIEILTKRFYNNIQVIILNGPCQGVNNNFLYLANHVISLNNDDYCCFFSDHDDLWHENKVIMYLNKIQNLEGDDFLIFSNSRLFSTQRSMEKDLWAELNYKGQVFGPSKLLIKNCVQGATICASRSIVETYVNMQNGTIMFDHLVAYIGALKKCIMPINSLLLNYRIHESNLIGIQARNKYSLPKLKYFLYRIIYFVFWYIKLKLLDNDYGKRM